MVGHLMQATNFHSLLAAPAKSPEIPDSADVYGWLCGSWDLEVLWYRGIDVSGRGLRGEVHASRVLEGRAVQDVWIMPPAEHRGRDVDRSMLQEGTRPDGTKTRWTFTGITASSFHWRGEALYPNKKTWMLEGEFIAERRSA